MGMKKIFKILALALMGVVAITMTSCNKSSNTKYLWFDCVYVVQEYTQMGVPTYTPYLSAILVGDDMKNTSFTKDNSTQIPGRLFQEGKAKNYLSIPEATTPFMSIEAMSGKYSAQAVNQENKVYDAEFLLYTSQMPEFEKMVVETFEITTDDVPEISLVMNKVDKAAAYGIYVKPLDDKVPAGNWYYHYMKMKEVVSGEDVWTFKVRPNDVLNNLNMDFERVMVYPMVVANGLYQLGEPKLLEKGNNELVEIPR